MRKLSTQEAFARLMDTPRGWEKYGINQNTWYSLRKRMREGRLISERKMEEVLSAAGWEIAQERLWRAGE